LLQNFSPGATNYFTLPVNYRQLVAAAIMDWCWILRLCLIRSCVLCLDVTGGDNGVLAALLLRALFNGLLQEQLSHQGQRLPELGSLLQPG
jgi:two-component system response regulator